MESYTSSFDTPLGKMVAASDGEALTGLWFEDQRYFGSTLPPGSAERHLRIFDETKRWLEVYFSGGVPDFTPPLRIIATPFRKRVLCELVKIPYGTTRTYGDIADALGSRGPTSARAVGGAVGHNPISIIIPCHRVIGASGALTGYAGGTERKKYLLDLERKS